MIVLFFVHFPEILKFPWQEILKTALTAGEAGLFEKAVSRGFVMTGLLVLLINNRHRIFYSALSSSLMFGLLHLSNLRYQSVFATLEQFFMLSQSAFCWRLYILKLGHY